MSNILITGATSGIGKKAVETLAQKGHTLCIVGRDPDKLGQLRNELGDSHIYIECDLCEPDSVELIFKSLKEKTIKLDGLVYCAGMAINQGIRGIDLASFEETNKVNFESYMAMCSYFIKKEFSNDGASIVCISSLSAKTCYSGTASYSVSKASMLAMNKVLSKEVARRRIRVNAILPGYVRTRMSEDVEESQVLAEQPFGYVETEDVVNAISFLLSDQSRMITGMELCISGGMQY